MKTNYLLPKKETRSVQLTMKPKSAATLALSVTDPKTVTDGDPTTPVTLTTTHFR